MGIQASEGRGAGGGHPDPEIIGGWGGGLSQKKIFSALRASFWSKIRGPSPLSATEVKRTAADLLFEIEAGVPN